MSNNVESFIDAKMINWLIAKGHLPQRLRHDRRAIEVAINLAFCACVFDPRPELNPQTVIEEMLRQAKGGGT